MAFDASESAQSVLRIAEVSSAMYLMEDTGNPVSGFFAAWSPIPAPTPLTHRCFFDLLPLKLTRMRKGEHTTDITNKLPGSQSLTQRLTIDATRPSQKGCLGVNPVLSASVVVSTFSASFTA